MSDASGNVSDKTSTNFLVAENSVFSCYLLCVCLLVLKMMGVILLTIFHRMKNKMFISSEDASHFNGEVKTNEQIDRVRRAHLNDLENIPSFCLVGFAYIFTDPPYWLAVTLFSLFTIVRFLHTFVYAIYVIRQPTRAALWTVGFLITGFMAIRTAIYAFISLI